jgi:pimeloyl-ACP methyl ester carboxylesterase
VPVSPIERMTRESPDRESSPPFWRTRVRYRWPAASLLLFALGSVALAYRGYVEAQWRAMVVLSWSLNTPVVGEIAQRLTEAPIVRNVVVAGVPTTIVLPPGGGRHPAIVFVNGATRAGRYEPHVERLTRALARSGYSAFVPDPPGLRKGEITVATRRSTAAVVRAVVQRADVARVSLLGASVGCSLALVAAERRTLAGRISAVAGLAPYTDLRAAIMMALTDRYPIEGGRSVRYRPDPFLGLVVARSLVAALPAGHDRRILLSRLEAIPDNDPAPLRKLSLIQAGQFGLSARRVLRLLDNRSPARFASLYAALPARVRAGIAYLSPVSGAGHLRLPVELASAPHDKYFPLAQYSALLGVAPSVHLTVTSTLQHAIPTLSLHTLLGLVRLDGFALRSLRDFAPPVPVNWLAVATALVALTLVAAEGFVPRHGLIGLSGAVALAAAVPAMLHPVGLRPPLVVALIAALAGVVLVGGRLSGAPPPGRRSQV